LKPPKQIKEASEIHWQYSKSIHGLITGITELTAGRIIIPTITIRTTTIRTMPTLRIGTILIIIIIRGIMAIRLRMEAIAQKFLPGRTKHSPAWRPAFRFRGRPVFFRWPVFDRNSKLLFVYPFCPNHIL
jgi:hypothetical protein